MDTLRGVYPPKSLKQIPPNRKRRKRGAENEAPKTWREGNGERVSPPQTTKECGGSMVSSPSGEERIWYMLSVTEHFCLQDIVNSKSQEQWLTEKQNYSSTPYLFLQYSYGIDTPGHSHTVYYASTRSCLRISVANNGWGQMQRRLVRIRAYISVRRAFSCQA